MLESRIPKFSGFSGYIIIASILLVMVFAAYSNTLYSPPVLDDFHTFIDEPLLNIQKISIESIISLIHTKFSFFRWVPMITFAMDRCVGGGEIYYFHITNIVIHCFSFLVVILLIFEINLAAQTQDKSDGRWFGPMPIAIFVAGLWALNPVQTCAVTYLVQRMTSLSSLFYCLSIALYIIGRRRTLRNMTNFGTISVYAASALTTVTACLCKENAAMIPVTMILTEWWFFQPGLESRVIRFCRHHPLACFCLGLACVALSYKTFFGLLAGFDGRHFTMSQRLMTEARVVVWYITALLWPDPRRLSLEHHIEVSTSFFDPLTTLLSIAFLFLLVLWTLIHRKRLPLVTFGVAWFLVNLLIESTVVPLELIFEHRMYLPSLGLFLALVDGVVTLVQTVSIRTNRRDAILIGWCVFAMIASAASLATYSRNAAWESTVSQSADDVVKQPNSPRARANYALALSRAGRYEEAIVEARVALGLGRKHYEQYGTAANTMMLCYGKLGEEERIIQEAPAILDNWPSGSDVYTKPSIYFHLASAQAKLGDPERAYENIKNALLHNLKMTMQIPHFEKLCAEELIFIFRLAEEKGLTLEGMEEVRAKRLGPNFWSTMHLLQFGYLAVGEQMMREMETIDTAHAEAARATLAAIDFKGQMDKAQSTRWSFTKKYVQNPFSRFNASMAVSFLIREYGLPSIFAGIGESFLDYALSLRPTSSDAHLLKGWYYFERGQIPEAVAAANRAIELEPDYAKAWMGLGFFLTKGPHPAEAVPAFSKALQLYPGYPQRASIVDLINSLQNEA